MRAVQITRFGGPEVLDLVDLPDPTPGEGRQLVDGSTAGVNYAALRRVARFIGGLGRLRSPHRPAVPWTAHGSSEDAGSVGGFGLEQDAPCREIAAFP
jgi:hypothetical protein